MCVTHRHSGSAGVEAILPRSATQSPRPTVVQGNPGRVSSAPTARIDSRNNNPLAEATGPARPNPVEAGESERAKPTPGAQQSPASMPAPPPLSAELAMPGPKQKPVAEPIKANFEIAPCAKFSVQERQGGNRHHPRMITVQIELPANQAKALQDMSQLLTKLKAEEPPESRKDPTVKAARAQWQIQAIVDVSAILGVDATKLKLEDPQVRNTQLTLLRSRYGQLLKINSAKAPAAKPTFFGFH